MEGFHHRQMFHEPALDGEGIYSHQTHHHQVLDEVVAEAGADVRAVLAEGDARDVLVKASEHAALLVVGSRGAGPVREVLLGSVSSYCVHHAICPVVVVRAPKPEHIEPKPVITPGPLL